MSTFYPCTLLAACPPPVDWSSLLLCLMNLEVILENYIVYGKSLCGPVIFGVDDYDYVMILPCQFAIHEAEFLYTCTLSCGLYCLPPCDRPESYSSSSLLLPRLWCMQLSVTKCQIKTSFLLTLCDCVSVCSDFLISQHFCSSKVNKQSVRSAVLLWQTSNVSCSQNWPQLN